MCISTKRERTVKILVIGDIHGESELIRAAAAVCRERGIRKIVQLGDYNYGCAIGFHKLSERYLAEDGVHMTVVPGNHENWNILDELYGYDHLTSEWPAREPVEIAPHISICHKFGIWPIAGKRCAFIGGGVSIDRFRRRQGWDWWPQESWNHTESERGLAIMESEEPVQVVFSHECLPEHPFKWGPARMLNDPACDSHAELMGEIRDRLKPSIWMHGHMHGFENYHTSGNIPVVSLGCYGDDFMAILDMETLEVSAPVAVPEFFTPDLRK
jgi:hypothetical protein